MLFTPDPVTAPVEFKTLLAKTSEKMIGMPAEISGGTADIVTLGTGDVPAMMELTKLTNPGPFGARTHELGTFLGVRVDGRLVAMAGERMKPADYTEITGRGPRQATSFTMATARNRAVNSVFALDARKLTVPYNRPPHPLFRNELT